MQITSPYKLLRYGFLLMIVSIACSCGIYRQDVMFKTDTDMNIEKMRASLAIAEKNYIIQPNDYLSVQVYTNRGERILDPNGEVMRSLSGGSRGGGNTNISSNQGDQQFLVQYDGVVKLPMVNYVKISGFTLYQADSLLQVKFTEFYKDVYVITKVNNNRIIVLGGSGGKVISMLNDNMNLLEVLALAGGVNAGSKAHNIRLIRGDLQNPSVQIIDLTTISGMRRAALNVEPGDVVYVEPVRRAFLEGLRDYLTIISAFTGAVTYYLLVKNVL
jgi:polysaccharide export outer membrane protein